MKAVLLLCLLSGVVGMLLPPRGESEWFHLLLSAVILVSFFTSVVSGFTDGFTAQETAGSVSADAAIREVFAREVSRIAEESAGEAPLRVESDLCYADGVFTLNEIRIVYAKMPNREVVVRAVEEGIRRDRVRVLVEEAGG